MYKMFRWETRCFVQCHVVLSRPIRQRQCISNIDTLKYDKNVWQKWGKIWDLSHMLLMDCRSLSVIFPSIEEPKVPDGKHKPSYMKFIKYSY